MSSPGPITPSGGPKSRSPLKGWTPFLNSSSIFFYLGHPFLDFRKDPQALETLQAILVPLLLRRTKETKGPDGTPIVKLPPKEVKVTFTTFFCLVSDYLEKQNPKKKKSG